MYSNCTTTHCDENFEKTAVSAAIKAVAIPLAVWVFTWCWHYLLLQYIADGLAAAILPLVAGAASVAACERIWATAKVVWKLRQEQTAQDQPLFGPKRLLTIFQAALEIPHETREMLSANACITTLLGAIIGLIATAIMLGATHAVTEPGAYLAGAVAVAAMKILTAKLWRGFEAPKAKGAAGEYIGIDADMLPSIRRQPSVSTATLASTTVLATYLLTASQLPLVSVFLATFVTGAIIAGTETVSNNITAGTKDIAYKLAGKRTPKRQHQSRDRRNLPSKPRSRRSTESKRSSGKI